MALKFVVGYWGRIWGAELLCGRVERKSTAIFDWSGLLSLSGQQCFCGDINFKRHMLFSWYRIVSCNLLGLSRICGFDHFGAIFDLAVGLT